MTRPLALLAGCLLLPAGTADDKPTPEDLAKAEQVVKDYLDVKKADGYKLERIDDPAVGRAFPNHLVYSVIFRQYPVARAAPEGLKSQNLFFVAGGKLTLVQDAKGLERVFREAAAPAKDEKVAADVALAWLRFAEELRQDGFYKFKTVEEATKAGGGNASAKATVSAGGNGEIKVELSFDADGKLTRASEAAVLKPGPRPICQATKLLDPDPLVRRICEQDLLIMGPPALEYLDEQAAKAPPELRAEIERVRRKILAGER
ncbi:MAG TPA: hypothetical protein VKE74_07095 [Gemmataceae bacterium]|nr:hypothetical protein [Gemmataceae bacterium]